MRKLQGSLKRGFWPKMVLIVMCVLSCLAGLGFLRFRVTNLAEQLNNINVSIQEYTTEEARLKQELSAIVAPIKIYTYCKERLGMQKVLKAESLPVVMRDDQQVASNKNNDDWLSSLSSWIRRETDVKSGD